MNRLAIPFLRIEAFRVSALAVVQVHVGDGVDSAQAIQAVRRAVTAWVASTAAGAALWRHACADLNIGDLACSDAFRDPDLVRLLRAEGLESVELLEACETPEGLSYDTVLADPPASDPPASDPPASEAQEDDIESFDDGPAALQRYTLHTLPNGAIEGRAWTNDDEDRGVPNTVTEWPVHFKDHADMLRRTGGTHVGVSGIQVEVVLDGRTVSSSERERA